MGWKPVDYDPFAEPQAAAPEAGPVAASSPAPDAVREGSTAPGWASRAMGGVRSWVTGEGKSEFPEAQEFVPAYAQSKGPNGELPDLGDLTRSAISPDPEAQFDILSRSIPGLQKKLDAQGNMMLKAPGMADWTYLNKPGWTARDADEIGTQTLATLPFMGWAGKAVGAGGQIVRGALAGSAASVGQDLAAGQLGSEQGVDVDRAGVNAAIGGVVPAVVPAVRGVLGAASGKAAALGDRVQKYTNPEAYAQKELQAGFAADARSGGIPPIGPADRSQAAYRGQDLRTMDFGGETVKAMGRKAANISPAARDEIMRVITPRYEGQAGRARNLFEGEFGFDRSVNEIGSQLKQQARQARQPLYDDAYRQGAVGYDSATLQQLRGSPMFTRAMDRAESTIKDRAAVPGIFSTGRDGKNGPTLEYWDQVKQRLDDMHGKAIRGGASARAMEIDRLRKALRDELDSAFPKYSGARGMAETFFDAGDALEAGKKFANGRFNLQDATQAINTLNPAEKKLFAEGYASKFIDDLRFNPDRSNILNRIAASEGERERQALALGSGRYNQLEAFLRLEGIMDGMRNAMGNSTTARQLKEMDSTWGTHFSGLNQNDNPSLISAILFGGGKLAGQAVDRKIADHMGRLLTSRNPEVFLEGLKNLSKGGALEWLRSVDNALSSKGFYSSAATGGQLARNSQDAADPMDDRQRALFDKARSAVARGAGRAGVEQRLREHGIDPRGL